jgi:hypothetical protein
MVPYDEQRTKREELFARDRSEWISRYKRFFLNRKDIRKQSTADLIPFHFVVDATFATRRGEYKVD